MGITKKELQTAINELDERIAIRLNKHFYTKDEIDAKFESVNCRFKAGDKRFDAMDKRFDAMDKRFDAMDTRFDAMDTRFDAIDRKFEDQMHQIKILFEDLKSNNLGLLHDKNDAQDNKLNDHEKRINKLEDRF